MRDLRISRIANAVVAWAILWQVSTALADDPPKLWAVTGVAADDVLHLRDVPHGDSRILADIPPNERALRNLGCLKPEPSLERWMQMTEDERRNAKLEWCRVEFHGQQGWVAARFLKPDMGPH